MRGLLPLCGPRGTSGRRSVAPSARRKLASGVTTRLGLGSHGRIPASRPAPFRSSRHIGSSLDGHVSHDGAAAHSRQSPPVPTPSGSGLIRQRRQRSRQPCRERCASVCGRDDDGRSALGARIMRERHNISGNEVGRPGPPVYMQSGGAYCRQLARRQTGWRHPVLRIAGLLVLLAGLATFVLVML